MKRPDIAEEMLRRLARLARLRATHADQLNERGLALVDHALYSTYLDLDAMGLAGRALQIMRQHVPPAS